MSYIYCASLLCDRCGKAEIERLGDAEDNGDSEGYPQWVDDDTLQSDSPDHCGSLSECLDYEVLSDGSHVGTILGGLTDNGIKYVIEKAAEGDVPSPCVQKWIEHFDIELPDLPAYAWPGGYPLVYIDKHGHTFCGHCAAQERGKGNAVTGDVYWEGEPLQCDECGNDIESAYGEVAP